MNTDLKIITQNELLTKSRELRDRVEISMHKLGSRARAYHTALNGIVAGLSQENAHPVDDNQTSIFDKPLPPRKQPKPVKAAAPKRKIELAGKLTSNAQARRTRETEDAAIMSIIGMRDRFWETARKNGASNWEIRDQLDKLMPESGSHSGPGICPISYRRNGLRVWFTEVEPRGGVAPHVHGSNLVSRIRRILEIPQPGKTKTSPKSAAAKKSTAAKAEKSKGKRKGDPLFLAPMQADEVLAAVVGSKPLPRTEITKKLWDYIKKNGLQDTKEKRQINADEKLQAVFGKSKVSMFEMNNLLQKHFSHVS